MDSDIAGLIKGRDDPWLDNTSREQATQALNHLSQFDPDNFTTLVLAVLSDQRALMFSAGALLRTHFSTKWRLLSEETKIAASATLFRLLESPNPDVRAVASLITVKVISINLLCGQWPLLLELIHDSVPPALASLKLTTLEVLDNDFSLERVPELVQQRFGTIIGDVLDSMVVPEGTDASMSRQIKEKGFKCLQRFVSTLYKSLGENSRTILAHTPTKGELLFSQDAVRFWISICAKEIGLVDKKDGVCLWLIKEALPHILPLVLAVHGDDIGDDVSTDITETSAEFIGLAAHLLGEGIVDYLVMHMSDLEAFERYKKWNWVMVIMMEKPSKRVLWSIGSILESFPTTRNHVYLNTWELIISMLAESIKNAETHSFEKALLIQDFFTKCHRQDVDSSSSLNGAISELAGALLGLCYTLFPLTLKTKACERLEALLNATTDRFATELMNRISRFIPFSDACGERLGEFTWKWERTYERPSGQITKTTLDLTSGLSVMCFLH